METIVLLILISFTGLAGGYTGNFQRTTLAVGKKLANDNPLLPTGLQDAITPAAQTRNNAVWFGLLVVIFLYSLIFFRWYIAVALPLLTLMVVTPIFSIFLPRPGSEYYLRKIRRDIDRRCNLYIAKGDKDRANAMGEVIRRLDSLRLEG